MLYNSILMENIKNHMSVHDAEVPLRLVQSINDVSMYQQVVGHNMPLPP